MKNTFTIGFLLLVSQIFFCQEDVIKSDIPVDLTIKANAVVRKNVTHITIKAIDLMTIKQKRVITIFNKKGNKFVNTESYYNDDDKINKLSLVIYDALGNRIRKFSKSDFENKHAVDGFSIYRDDKIAYVNYTPTNYPYTAVFDYELKTASTAFIPSWNPILGYNISIMHSSFIIENPKLLPLKIKENLFKKYHITNSTAPDIIKYTLQNQPSIPFELNSPSSDQIFPKLLVAMNRFMLRGIEGKGKNWKEFGKWYHDQLLSNKAKLDSKTIMEVKALTKDASHPIEKAKILYNFMQQKTRYVSVQMGIGGWQPTPAKSVNNLGYGDCKGLTNYTMALLNAVGIPSHFSIVYAKNRKDIDTEFASLQGNHVILNIPNDGDDIWLECTNQHLPFGFLGDFTEDRDVLVIKPEGGVIKRTPAYKNETNLQKTNALIDLDTLGNLTANLIRKSEGLQYENKYKIASYNEKELNKFYKKNAWSYLNNITLLDYDIFNDKDSIQLSESLNISLRSYATLNEQEFIFNINTFNRQSYIPRRYRNRNLPLEIKHGYKDCDEYTFNLPVGYAPWIPPQNIELKTKFGDYTVTIVKKGLHNIVYKKTLTIKAGIYPASSYAEYRKFRKQIAKYENLRVILKKIK